MNEKKCQICRAELNEVIITQDKDLEWEDFLEIKAGKRGPVIRDKED